MKLGITLRRKPGKKATSTTTGRSPDGLGHHCCPSFEGAVVFPVEARNSRRLAGGHHTAPQPRASPSSEPERTGAPEKQYKWNQVSHTGRTGTLGTDTIRLRASGSGTTLPQTMWLKPDSVTWDPRRGAIRPPSSLALTQKTVVTQLRVKRRPMMARRSSLVAFLDCCP